MLGVLFRLILLVCLAFPGLANGQAFFQAANNGTPSPGLAFTSLTNGSTSSTTTGSGTYTVAAPSGLTSVTYGGGCSGSSTVSGFSASGGTWSATFTTPSSACTGTLAVTGTGSNTATATSPSASFTSSGGNVAFTPLHLYFVSPSIGSDSNDGLAPTTGGGHGPWASYNHNVVCGDVILAGPGNYPTSGMNGPGTVSGCPSTSGGIDGMGGIYFATLLCAGTDLGTGGCNMNFQPGGSSGAWAFSVDASNWAIEGFTVTGNQGNGIFAVNGSQSTNIYHHVAFINNITQGVQIGFGAQDNGLGTGGGYDYVAYIGNIAQNSENNPICTAAMVMVSPHEIDSINQTHYLMYGNFSFNNTQNAVAPPNCQVNSMGMPAGTDVENFMFDTFDAYTGMTGSGTMLNNIGWSAWRMGIQMFFQHNTSMAAFQVNFYNNTMFANDIANGGFGEINVQANNSTAPPITANLNIGFANTSAGCGASVGGSTNGSIANIKFGSASGLENILFATNGGSAECAFQTFSFGANNFQTNPNFNSTTDLLNNRSGAPNCTGFTTTTACMGWNANTSTLTTNTPIYDLTPTCSQCGGKGYQLPSTTCVSSGNIFNIYPSWLKGIVYLQSSGFTSGATITENADLVTKPCNL